MKITTLLVIVFLTVSSLQSQESGQTQKSVSIIPASPRLEQTCLYSLEFNLPDSLLPNGAISIIFPETFDLSNVALAASTSINGGLATLVNGSEIIVFRKGEGDLKARGTRVDIKLSAIGNPKKGAGSHGLRVFVHEDGDKIKSQIRNRRYKPQEKSRTIEGTFYLTTN